MLIKQGRKRTTIKKGNPVMRLRTITGLGTVASLLLALGAAAAADVTKGPVTDALGVVVLPKDAPSQIGGMYVLSGADASLGLDERRGVELAIEDLGGKVAGRDIKFTPEDSLCNAEGGQTAASKLAANPNIVIVIGPTCSSEATPGSPILWKAGIANVAPSPTAPFLTAEDRGSEYDGFFRTIAGDIEQAKSDAAWFHDVLKVQKIVIVHDGSPYSKGLAKEMGKGFTAMGGTVLAEEAIQPTDVDMHPLLTRIATVKPDAIYLPLFVAAGAQILRQSKETPGLENVAIIGSAGLSSPDMLEAAKDAVVGFRVTGSDTSPEAMGKGYPRFVEQYKEKFGEQPISSYHANAYDAAMLAFKAIEAVAKTDGDGVTYIGRKALQEALRAVKFDGISGPIACDAHGACAQLKTAVYEYTNPDPDTFEMGTNPKKIWP